MLSILVPIYNYNVFPLVSELHKQCIELNIDFEILCQDDASNSKLNQENEKVNTLSHCSFVALTQNIAHRANRNSLVEKSKYEFLLFIDGDSNIIYSNYIKKYLDNLNGFDIVYGGRLHPQKCPSNHQKLRWKYGKFMEDKVAIQRQKLPYQSLLFNNTLIKKDLFSKVQFDKMITKYGHDDTQLSFQLSLLDCKLKHINNQIEHGDIDTNNDYYSKTKESVQNLISLVNDKKIDGQFNRLYRLNLNLKKFHVDSLISKLYLTFEKRIAKNLTGNNPSLFIFNLFKIGYLCSLKQE
jgi:glycosyltransferase involved in cell wall biosynthesis